MISKWKLCQFESIGGKTNLSLKLCYWDRVQKNALHLLKRRWNPVDNDLPQLSLDQEHQHERHWMSKQVRSKKDQVKEWKIFWIHVMYEFYLFINVWGSTWSTKYLCCKETMKMLPLNFHYLSETLWPSKNIYFNPLSHRDEKASENETQILR